MPATMHERAMENPLLESELLPSFSDIRAEHVEPAIRSLLEENRARIAELIKLPQPTFADLVEPLEDMHHRLSRVWSPVSHLNAVVNSPESSRVTCGARVMK